MYDLAGNLRVDPRIVAAIIDRDPDRNTVSPTMEETVAFDNWVIATYGEKIHTAYLTDTLKGWRRD